MQVAAQKHFIKVPQVPPVGIPMPWVISFDPAHDEAYDLDLYEVEDNINILYSGNTYNNHTF